MKKLGIQIKTRRRELGIRQQEVADLAGVSINTLGAVETGNGNPSLSSILAVCEVLGLELTVKLKD